MAGMKLLHVTTLHKLHAEQPMCEASSTHTQTHMQKQEEVGFKWKATIIMTTALFYHWNTDRGENIKV